MIVAIHPSPRMRPPHSVYVRRRLIAGLLCATVLGLGGVTASSALADRGDVPASIPAVRPAAASASMTDASQSAPRTYVTRAGDTLWAIAEAHHGEHSIGDYVELLIDGNGGTTLQVGQQIVLP